MIFFAPCKINLGLQILRKRPDGYHDIATVMMRTGWRDIVEAVPSHGGEDTLTVTGRAVDCLPQDNLVMKAARMLRETVDFPAVDLYLHKTVPDGAGLGGGSSDAASAVKAIDALYSLGLTRDEMAQVLAGVGSDCPFFAYDTPMYATGRGTDLSPVAIPQLDGLYLLIAKPSGCHVSTRQAYAGVIPNDHVEPLTEIITAPVEQWQEILKNDFEPSVFAVAPAIGHLKQRLLDFGAVYASMSGSGAAVFGIFREEPDKPVIEEIRKSCDVHLSRI